MRTACIVAAILNMSLIRSLTTRFTTFSRQSSFPTSSLKALSSSSEHYSVSEDNWTEYMIEFRGIQAAFRLNELRDSYKHVMKGTDKEDLVLTSIIADVLFPDIPICAYVRLPNDTIAIDITKRCSLVRSISQVWGDSSTFNGVRDEAEKKYDSLIAPHFNNGLGNNSWRVDFRRYGRSGKSGLDPEGKKNVLLKFNTIFKKMDSQVDLFESKHSLLYLEDWSTYRPWVDSFAISKSTDATGTTEKKEIVRENDRSNSNSDSDSNSNNNISEKQNERGKVSKPYRSRISYMADAPAQSQQSQTDLSSDSISISSSSNSSSSSSRNIKKNKTSTLSLGEINHDDGTYVPLRFIFGRIITEGPNVLSDFDLRRRPYLGTTTMDPVVSHVAAVAGRAAPGSLILDPFCGTGSLLLACAFLGADVVGSDIDGDCLGLAPTDIPLKDRSKNSRFLRYGENAGSQEGKSTVDNFHHYGLRSKLRALIGVDAALWREGDSSVSRDFLAGYSGCDSTLNIEEEEVENEVEVEVSDRIRGSERGSGDSKSKHQQRGTWEVKEVEQGSVQDSDIERPYGWHEDLDQYGQFDAIVTDPPYSKREKGIVFDADSVPSGIEFQVSNSVAVNSREKNREKKKIKDDKEKEEKEGEEKERSMGGREGSESAKATSTPSSSSSSSLSSFSSSSTSTSPSSSTSTSTSAPPSSEMMGDAFATTSCLFALASHRLKQGGKLVFWLPTRAFISEEDVIKTLAEIEHTAYLSTPKAVKMAGTSPSPSTGTTGTTGPHGHGLGLVLERVTAEKLNRSLWRWLCVYHRL